LKSQLGEPTHEQPIEMALQEAEEEARRYAVMPARFTFICMEVHIKTDDGQEMLIGSLGDWSCTCRFYEEWNTCSHAMAIESLLKRVFSPPSYL